MNRKESAKATRQEILKAAYHEIHRNGFQQASLDAILARTGVTKGALYHHFPNKKALGYAVVDEVIQEIVNRVWLSHFEKCQDPISAIQKSITEAGKLISHNDVMLGCPLNNLCQEMAPIDEGFRHRVNSVYEIWRQVITKALQQGQNAGSVRQEIAPDDSAAFIVASLAGCRSLSKSSQSRELLKSCAGILSNFLETLRPKYSA